ncbi:MAG: CheR family methyltransferase [Janthinobacterium lividum]
MEELILTDKEFGLFRDLIYQLAGIALNPGKRQLVQSRLQKRRHFYNHKSFGEYYALVSSLHDGDPELTTFVNCITTNKTDFFREPHHFEFIAETIIPELAAQVRRHEREPRLRVWHAGCSTGEEPYTLAITLAEAQAALGGWDVRQLASDIDTNVLAHAETAVYSSERIAPVPQHLQHKYFLRGTGIRQDEYKVKSLLREQITFRQINLLDNDWPIRSDVQFDMIFCRNVVIYFDKPTQQRLFARFQERLLPGGYLFLGHSESLFGNNGDFDSVGHTIYRLRERQEQVKAA